MEKKITSKIIRTPKGKRGIVAIKTAQELVKQTLENNTTANMPMSKILPKSLKDSPEFQGYMSISELLENDPRALIRLIQLGYIESRYYELGGEGYNRYVLTKAGLNLALQNQKNYIILPNRRILKKYFSAQRAICMDGRPSTGEASGAIYSLDGSVFEEQIEENANSIPPFKTPGGGYGLFQRVIQSLGHLMGIRPGGKKDDREKKINYIISKTNEYAKQNDIKFYCHSGEHHDDDNTCPHDCGYLRAYLDDNIDDDSEFNNFGYHKDFVQNGIKGLSNRDITQEADVLHDEHQEMAVLTISDTTGSNEKPIIGKSLLRLDIEGIKILVPVFVINHRNENILKRKLIEDILDFMIPDDISSDDLKDFTDMLDTNEIGLYLSDSGHSYEDALENPQDLKALLAGYILKDAKGSKNKHAEKLTDTHLLKKVPGYTISIDPEDNVFIANSSI